MATMDWLQALWASPAQTNRLLRLRTPLGGDTLVAEELDGWEAIDHGGFRLQLSALSPTTALPLDTLLGAPVLLELLTADSLTALRPFHGHVTAVERVGANGGLARYRLTLEPWLALLGYRQDSYLYRDATVIEIVEQVFGHYRKGVVLPSWRWELADRSVYKRRSLTSQYQETDFAFVTRLLAEEGIFYWFEHTGDAGAAELGSHTLVLADSNQAFEADAAQQVRFHRGDDATERADAIQHWQPVRRWQTGTVSRASWDYRTLSLRPAGASADGAAAPATDDDTAGPYAWVDGRQGNYRARQQLDALHVASWEVQGSGTLRTLAPGRCIELTEYSGQPPTPQVCLRVHHRARNNFTVELRSRLEAALGEVVRGDTSPEGSVWPWAGEPLSPEEADVPWHVADNEGDASRPAMPEEIFPPDDAADPVDFYRNRFVVLDAGRAYRPRTEAGHGLRRQPVATISGAQSAIVTGAGEPLHTDRDHRVIVQQHWQRGGNAASRLDHPRQADAPADAVSGTWARVLTPLAGANWGTVMLPRVGQEVWLNYLEGDVDRPVVVAGLYNGQGNADAPYNRQAGGPSGATGNAAAWFTGNRHAGVLSGIKSQDLASSTSGTGGYRQLRFDDTPNQGHVQLGTTDYETALTLGHLKQVDDNAREGDLGYGAALGTSAQGALRGAAGLLVSSSRGADQMDAREAAGVLTQTAELAKGLVDVAQRQGAQLAEEPAPDKLHAVAGQADLAQELVATREGTAPGGGIGGGEGGVTAWSKPHLVVHGEAGLAVVTPQNHVWVSGTDTALTAGQDLGWIAQGQWSAVAAKGIALYVQGGKPPAGRPIDQTGIHLHAASGQVSVQAQQDRAAFVAEKAVTVSSSEASVAVQAKAHVLLTAAGAYLKLQGGDIEIGAPGNALFKGAQRELAGPQSANPPQIKLAKGKAKLCEFKTRAADADGAGTVPLEG